MTEITDQHRNKLEEIKKSLSTIGCREASFLKIELLFYEAIEISRSYGNDPDENPLLKSLKSLQASEYQKTKELYKKSSQRELSIRRFISQLKKVLGQTTLATA